MKNNISHEGHRQRLKKRFILEGLDSFEPHNILELLLFYAIPRKDTNEIAHDLLMHFGSLKGVFDADYSELIKISGISENTATLIKMIPGLCREYSVDKYSASNIFDTAEKLGMYLVDKYIGEVNEVVYAVLLNNRFEMIATVKIHEGSVNSAQVSPRKILDQIIKYNASMVVISHNHPNGVPIPSMDDIDTTSSMMSAFDMFDIRMIEHFLISGNEYVPLVHETFSLQHQSDEHKHIFRNLNKKL